MSLALSLCQYVLRPWPRQASPGLAWLRQASASLEAPRLQACINIIERKDSHDQDKKVQEASFGVRFLHLKLI